MRLRRWARAAALAWLVAAAPSCFSAATPRDRLADARAGGAQGDRAAAVEWLAAELTLPGGQPEQAAKARTRVESLAGDSLSASFVLALDDQLHGRVAGAVRGFVRTLELARDSTEPHSQLFAWHAAHHVTQHHRSVPGFWDELGARIDALSSQPGRMGFRARLALWELWSTSGYRREAATPGFDYAARARALGGCLDQARMAGPFGTGAGADVTRAFDAERPFAWPTTFQGSARRLEVPRTLPVTAHACALRPTEAQPRGVYFTETFLDLDQEREVLLVATGALAMRVDDVEVLRRDPRAWGVWPRFGARLRLSAGRHRWLVKTSAPETALFALTGEGLPLGVRGSTDPHLPYTQVPPTHLPDPNALEPFLRAVGVERQAGALDLPPVDTDDPLARYVAAGLAVVERQGDLAAVLLEPLVRDKATGAVLELRAQAAERDPAFGESAAQNEVAELAKRAVERDGQLLFPSIWLALQETETQGLGAGGRSLKALAEKFPESPEPLRVLASLYSSAGYRFERAEVVRELAKRFPDDPQALTALLEAHEELGEHAKADEVAARLERVMPGSEIKLTRALARRDYAGAVAELERLRVARPDLPDIVGRIADLLVRSGEASESLQKLERAVADTPTDAQARLALADARYASGQGNALTEGIVEALRSGADPAPLREAVELVEGRTALEAFRLDTRKVLAEFDASRVKLPGGAARVLDYGAMRVFPDGSFRMLEHEIIRIQDSSGIQSQAETPLPRGWLLKLRVLKKDGRVLEPELIEGKPTVTMPHLEVGDSIETESISSYRGDGTGRRFDGPRWYFREEGLPYYRSEFVVVAPEHRALDVETTGTVPPPTKSTSGGLVTLRYRVDESPALPVEPAMAPLSEFLPSVRVGWGLSRADTLARLVDAAADLTPLDPRLRRVATKEAGTGTQAERAARLYRYVMQTVQAGRESDPRRVLFGKSGSRLDAFRYLCRLAGIESTLAIARDRLAPPAKGRLSEAEVAGGLLLRLELDGAPRWLELRSELAPFGYVPSSYRGQRAWLLRDEGGEELVPDEGSPDLVSYTGKGTLSADGGLDLDLEQSFVGRLAIDLRGELRSVAAAELQQDVEASLARTFPGAALRELEVLGLDEVDKPLTLRSKLRISAFGKPTSAGFALTIPPFVRLAPVATLPARETAIYVSERLSKDVRVSIRLTLPPQAKVTSSLASAALGDGPRSVKVSDRVEGKELVFDRTIVIPPGRIQPAEYPSFRTFATDTDAALGREIELEVPRSSP